MTQDPSSSSGLRRRPTTSETPAGSREIDPNTFYGTGLGSSSTSYIAPASSFQEPLLVDEEPIPKDTYDWAPSNTWGDPNNNWDGNLNVFDSWGESGIARKIKIDGRDEDEELRWFDAAVRTWKARPGPGVLPPLLADMLHDPDHALYSVSAQPHPTPTSPAPPHTPTADEVRMAIPHPNAYFCREHNGWVLLSWKSSTVLPPLHQTPETPLPDQNRRKQSLSCIAEAEQPFGSSNSNMTHHWHGYKKAVDATKLNPPYVHGVIPAPLMHDVTLDKINHPAIDKTPKATVVAAWETVLTIIDNRLWRDEVRGLPVGRPRFQTKVGWNDNVERVFRELGFPLDHLPQGDGNPTELSLQPPAIDPATPEGKASRTKLLRAWVELSAWLAIYEKAHKEALKNYNPMVIHVKADSERDLYQTAIGAHVSQLSRRQMPDVLSSYTALDSSWKALGMTPNTYTWELLAFAYLAQCRCDPANTPQYFAHLGSIVQTMLDLQINATDELQALIIEERTRYRFTPEDYLDAACMLGFGRENDLGLELDGDVDDDFIAQAWRSARQRAWLGHDPEKKRAQLNDALKIVAEQRGSESLLKVWSLEKGSGMSVETAYQTLDVPKDVEESILVTVFGMRVEDQPSQSERMREALSVIAEVRNSERLRQFLATGNDPGDSSAIKSPEMPRGINQLGNTCYLNSLLQYFYTIKDLRAAIASLANAGVKAFDEKKFTDDDLKRHRVGGRLVTRREIMRSKKFVHLLADLFWNLEFSENTAVTPEVELAKLALVTSQDEEEDEIMDKAGTDSSNDTDATLVDDMAPRSAFDRPASPLEQLQSPKSPTGSVLGKRSREGELAMDVDTPVHTPPGPSSSSSSNATVRAGGGEASEPVNPAGSSSKRPLTGKDADLDVEMKEDTASQLQSAKVPPPLPPRKARQTDDSVMMFGRQHDVSECMDNCMFQIETALLDFQGMATSDDDKTSPVKRLFYGKKRQRLLSLSPHEESLHQSSIHEKEDLFSHLHVNVADEGFDLYDGLARYFDDVVEVGGQKKRMEVSIVDPPPLLQVQLQRVQFNRETQQAYKSQAYVKFGETIYLDRFLDSANPEKKARSKAVYTELTAARERVQRLTQGKHAPFAPAFTNAIEFLSKQTAMALPPDDELLLSLTSEESLIEAQLRADREQMTALKAQIEDAWKDETSAAYELTSVFIHRGSSPSWGHYFFYSRNLPGRPDEWFKYNDSDVSAVSKEEVLADTTGSTANPYMLVFVRKGLDVIDTVHRFDPDLLQEAE